MISAVIASVLIVTGSGLRSFAETTPSQSTAAGRLLELGYLSEDYTSESIAIALRDFKKANNLPEDMSDEDVKTVLLSANALTQQEYISGKAQAMREQTPLSMGAYGESVLQLQTALALYGYFADECNGAFNETTEIAVCRFQLACGLNITGIADRTIYLRLYDGEPGSYDDFLKGIVCAPGDSGDNVRTLQIWLGKLGIKGFSATGSYGSLTGHAVEVFQRLHELEVTGIADFATVRTVAEEVLTLRRAAIMAAGDAAPEEVASLLENAGYDPGEGADTQTELSLMKYQKQHGLTVTGIADSETVTALRNNVLPVSDDEMTTEPDYSVMADYAYSLIGKSCKYVSSYGLPEYVYLKCGMELPAENSAQTETVTSIMDAVPGEVIKATGVDGSLWGISIGNGGMICVRDELAVLCYPSEGCEVCRLSE